MILAAWDNKMEILQYFVEDVHADVNFARPDGGTAVYFAAKEGSLDALKFLADHGGLIQSHESS